MSSVLSGRRLRVHDVRPAPRGRGAAGARRGGDSTDRSRRAEDGFLRIFTNYVTPCFSPDARVIVVPRSDRAVSMHRALPLLLFSLALAARAGEVAQFRAEDFGADWRAYGPGTPGVYMHHGASFEIRSKPISGGHGHQATYDGNGLLISDGTIAAGTADFVSPDSLWDGSMSDHREKDVKPYVMSVHLDGNPGRPDNQSGLISEVVPLRLSRPCIFQGANIGQYLTLRPSFPTGIEENE